MSRDVLETISNRYLSAMGIAMRISFWNGQRTVMGLNVSKTKVVKSYTFGSFGRFGLILLGPESTVLCGFFALQQRPRKLQVATTMLAIKVTLTGWQHCSEEI